MYIFSCYISLFVIYFFYDIFSGYEVKLLEYED